MGRRGIWFVFILRTTFISFSCFFHFSSSATILPPFYILLLLKGNEKLEEERIKIRMNFSIFSIIFRTASYPLIWVHVLYFNNALHSVCYISIHSLMEIHLLFATVLNYWKLTLEMKQAAFLYLLYDSNYYTQLVGCY